MTWLEAAFADHRKDVFSAAYAVLHDRDAADDVVQEVFLRLGRDRAFDPGRGQLGPYLRMLGRSRALDHHRSVRAAERTRERWARLEPLVPAGPEAADVVLVAGEDARLRAAVAALPAAQREAVALTYWGGLSVAEVAARTRAPIGTAKSRVRLGLSRLRQELAV